MKGLKEAGGELRMKHFIASLGGSWAVLGLILPRFFAFVFNIDFSSIFSRFRNAFGKDLGGQNGPESRVFSIFWDMLVETLFLVEFCVIDDKIDG